MLCSVDFNDSVAVLTLLYLLLAHTGSIHCSHSECVPLKPGGLTLPISMHNVPQYAFRNFDHVVPLSSVPANSLVYNTP